MFKKMATKKSDIENSSVNLIGAGTVIEGNISTTGDIRIDGTLSGSVRVKGKLVLGVSGSIDGDVDCQNGDVSGTITGTIKVAELLSLKASSKLNGDIFTNKLSIEPGATFTGGCNMGVIKDINDADRSKENKQNTRKAKSAW
jgi:cytoskeletal protein CcmA (bactofilin family)